MAKICEQGIVVPDLIQDPCGGENIKASCVRDSNLYTDLSLEANASQQDINQALYLAFKNLKQIVDNL